MCDTIYCPSGREIDTLRELIVIWPEPVMNYDVPMPDALDCCICPVDVDATLEKYSVQYERDNSRGWMLKTELHPSGISG